MEGLESVLNGCYPEPPITVEGPVEIEQETPGLQNAALLIPGLYSRGEFFNEFFRVLTDLLGGPF